MAELSSPLADILDLARWAPSGDNTQIWRFEVLADDHVLVHGFDTRHWCVYDLDGHASQLAVGALLETLAIAATAHALRADITRRPDTPDTHLLFDVRLVPDASISPSPLLPCIETRSVQRRPMGTRALDEAERAALETAAAPYRVVWFGSLAERARIAKLNFDSAEIRLTIPEAYATHTRVIEWGARFSEDRIPEIAVGVDPMTAKLMKFVMKRWSRVEFFNRWLCGTLAPRIQLDFVPGIACSAHAFLVAPKPPTAIEDNISAGTAVQRLWLTCEKLGLQLQPEMTPLIFSHYANATRRFTELSRARELASDVASRLGSLLTPTDVGNVVWACRIGDRRDTPGRSLRHSLKNLQQQADRY